MKEDLTVTMEVLINAPVTNVWNALTNPEDIKQYLYGTDTITDWKVGSPIYFTGTWEEKEYTDKGTILQCEKEKILQYSYWSAFSGIPDVPENYSIVTFQLEPAPGGTKLMLSQSSIPTREGYEHSQSGWKMVLEQLKELVEKKVAQDA